MSIQKTNIAVIGLGYVGLPLAVEFGKQYNVVGFDLNEIRINELKTGFDRTNELSQDQILFLDKITITNDKRDILDSNIYIVTVPTPVDKNNKPDLTAIISASKLIGGMLKK